VYRVGEKREGGKRREGRETHLNTNLSQFVLNDAGLIRGIPAGEAGLRVMLPPIVRPFSSAPK
jgi:hypothetical protein